MTKRTTRWLLCIVLVLVLAFSFTLAACGNNPEQEQPGGTTPGGTTPGGTTPGGTTTQVTATFVGGDGATGTAPAAITVNQGEEITFPANTFSKENFTFDGWGDGTTTYQPGAKLALNENKTFTAQWKSNGGGTNPPQPGTTYTITVIPAENGTVAIDPEEGPYAPNTLITVTATPSEGYEIHSFSVNGTAVAHVNGVYSFEITQNTEIDVVFAEEYHPTTYKLTLQLDVPETGTISADPAEGPYEAGTSVTVTFAPATGYQFDHFTVQGTNGTLTDEDKLTYTFKILGDTTIRAFFKATETAATLPDYFNGEWTQFNNAPSVTAATISIGADGFSYNGKTYQIVQTVEGYAYKLGSFTTPIGFVDDVEEGRTVLFVRMSGTNYYLFSKDGSAPDGTFPKELFGTKWDNIGAEEQEGTMGRLSFDATGKGALDNGKLNLLFSEEEEGTFTLHILYNGAYWILTYTDGQEQLTFAQVGGAGQNTSYALLKATPLGSDYLGSWDLLGDLGLAIEIDADGYLHIGGEIVQTFAASKTNYEFDFIAGEKSYGVALTTDNKFLLIVNLSDKELYTYIKQGEQLPDETVDLPEAYNGDWTFTQEHGVSWTLNISNGAMTIEGEKVYYYGQEQNSEGYIARAVWRNVYFDIAQINSSGIIFGNILFDEDRMPALTFTRGSQHEEEDIIESYYQGAWTQLNPAEGADPIAVTIGGKTITIGQTEYTLTNEDGYGIVGTHEQQQITIEFIEEYGSIVLMKIGTQYFYQDEVGEPEEQQLSAYLAGAYLGKTFSDANSKATLSIDAEGYIYLTEPGSEQRKLTLLGVKVDDFSMKLEGALLLDGTDIWTLAILEDEISLANQNYDEYYFKEGQLPEEPKIDIDVFYRGEWRQPGDEEGGIKLDITKNSITLDGEAIAEATALIESDGSEEIVGYTIKTESGKEYTIRLSEDGIILMLIDDTDELTYLYDSNYDLEDKTVTGALVGTTWVSSSFVLTFDEEGYATLDGSKLQLIHLDVEYEASGFSMTSKLVGASAWYAESETYFILAFGEEITLTSPDGTELIFSKQVEEEPEKQILPDSYILPNGYWGQVNGDASLHVTFTKGTVTVGSDKYNLDDKTGEHYSYTIDATKYEFYALDGTDEFDLIYFEYAAGGAKAVAILAYNGETSTTPLWPSAYRGARYKKGEDTVGTLVIDGSGAATLEEVALNTIGAKYGDDYITIECLWFLKGTEAYVATFGDKTITLKDYTTDPHEVVYTLVETFEFSDIIGVWSHEDEQVIISTQGAGTATDTDTAIGSIIINGEFAFVCSYEGTIYAILADESYLTFGYSDGSLTITPTTGGGYCLFGQAGHCQQAIS